jgi:hypothetical protein
MDEKSFDKFVIFSWVGIMLFNVAFLAGIIWLGFYAVNKFSG